jgi:hypothetical protein
MIQIRVSSSPRPQPATPAWHADFLALLPAIQRRAWRAFRGLDPEARADAVEEVLANALVAFVRLVELGKAELAYATPLASYGIRRFHEGRRIGARLNVQDVSSPYCQQAKGLRVGRLDHYDRDARQWQEVLVEDRRVGPAETAAARLDFAAWLARLSPRRRRMAQILAGGEPTSGAARRFCLSPGRVSQIRGELENSWLAFQGQTPARLATA